MSLYFAASAVFSLILCVDGLTDAEIAKFTSLGCGVRLGTCSGKFMYGEISLTKDADAGTIRVVANGIPDHPICNSSISPGETCYNDPLTSWLEEQEHDQLIPLNPEVTGTKMGLPAGEVGYAINGVSILSPYALTCEDAVASEAIGFDDCDGHPQEQGDYHYHAAPICLPGYMEAETSQTQFLVGVAWDGFPIYNKFDADGAEIDNSMLDECHGYNTTDGTGYRYIVNDEFPYIIGCFVGTPVESVSEACGGTSRRRLSAEKIARIDAEVQSVLSRRRLLQGGGGSNSGGGGSNNGGSGSSSTQEVDGCGTACSGVDCAEDTSVAMCDATDADTPSPSLVTDASEPTVNPTHASEPTLNPTVVDNGTPSPSSPTESPIADDPVDNSSATALRGVMIVAVAAVISFC